MKRVWPWFWESSGRMPAVEIDPRREKKGPGDDARAFERGMKTSFLIVMRSTFQIEQALRISAGGIPANIGRAVERTHVADGMTFFDLFTAADEG
jgi:hypothetical protein